MSAAKSVAIIGASSDRSKFGNKSVRAHAAQGWDVYPVNPKGGQIEGIAAYRSVAEIPALRLDRVSMYLPPALALQVLDAVAQKGCDELFLNPGSDTPEVIERARELGLNAIQACSIVDVGMSPAQL
jgi:predicted CoA-binding protein